MPKFSYQRRPAKHIERLLIVEACRRLVHLAPLAKYSYLGFGGLEFIDFELFHRALGIENMISIEKNSDEALRYDFNRPFDGVTLKIGTASDHLPEVDWRGLHIVWLDYECTVRDDVIRDCETVARNAIPGSVLIVTVNCYLKGEDKMALFSESVEPERVPDDVTDASLKGKWGVADAQRQVLTDVVTATFADRHDGSAAKQLLNFRYSDNARMQTLGWIVSGPAVDQAIQDCRFEDLPFTRTGDDAMEIRIPILTQREIHALNDVLPAMGKRRVKWLKEEDQLAYAELYRWYPSGGE